MQTQEDDVKLDAETRRPVGKIALRTWSWNKRRLRSPCAAWHADGGWR